MRCPECGSKECCGASLTAERDRLREALQGVVRCWESDLAIGHPVDRYFYAQAKAALQEAE